MRCFTLALAAAFAVSALEADDLSDIIQSLRAGNYRMARDLSDAAIKRSPNDPRLWTLDGVALSKLGSESEALTSFRHALNLNMQYVPALEGAAQLLYEERKQDAVPLLQKLLNLHPEDKTSAAMLAVLAFDRGDCKEGLTYFEKSRALMESQKSSLEQAGACLVKLNRSADAVPVFQQILNFQPDDLKARTNLALVQGLSGHYQDVIATLAPVANAGAAPADALELLAEAYESVSDTPHAVQYLRAAITKNPDAVRYYLDFADLCLVHASYQVGVDMLDFGLKRLPHSSDLYIARGVLFAQMGQYRASEDDFAKADELDPHAAQVSAAQGMLALQQNKLEEAETTLRARMKKEPQNAFLYYLLAETLVKRGAKAGSPEFEQAIQAASTAIRLQPDFPLARDTLAKLYLSQGKTAPAIEQSRIAVREDPTDQTALYHLILGLRKANKSEELPALLARLTRLREEAREKEEQQRKYALVEGLPSSSR